MSATSFLDAFRMWFAEREAPLPIRLEAIDEDDLLIRLEFAGIRILEVQVRDIGEIVVEVATTEGFLMATLLRIRVPEGDTGAMACQHFERWIKDRLAGATAVGLTGFGGPDDAHAVLLRDGDSIDRYDLTVALRG